MKNQKTQQGKVDEFREPNRKPKDKNLYQIKKTLELNSNELKTTKNKPRKNYQRSKRTDTLRSRKHKKGKNVSEEKASSMERFHVMLA
jgi:uncharacterized membrane protein